MLTTFGYFQHSYHIDMEYQPSTNDFKIKEEKTVIESDMSENVILNFSK